MSWADLHTQSERLAIEAQAALRAGDSARAEDFYTGAAQFEQQALDQLEPTKTRTRGIIAVSAVALWFKATDYVAAERLAHALLAANDLPAFAREELRNLVQAIWIESAKQGAGVKFVPGEVLVSIKGGDVVTGGAPLDLIVDKVQTIQSLFYRTIEFMRNTPHRKVGRPSREIQDACQPWLFQSVPGSYQFSVAIQKPVQKDFFAEDIAPERIAHHFLEIVSASSNEDPTAIETVVPDAAYRSTFLRLIRGLAPTGKVFERMELRASGETQAVALGVESRININRQLRSNETQASPNVVPEELHGTLRAVHLDKDWLDVVVDGASVHVEGLRDTVDDIIGPMVNRAVVVRAVRVGIKKKLKFADIELVE